MTRSTTPDFSRAIDTIRSEETVEQVFALKDNTEVQKLVAAWPAAKLISSPTCRQKSQPQPDSDLWEWIWTQRTVDLDDLALKLGTCRTRAAAALEIARGNRLVYPDGTVHEQALLYIRALVARDLGVKPSQLSRR